ncbi:MAG: UPF0179 family protein [Candidatus Thermoplasmatota archaeon]|jgi:uncharacterized protein (UPF0179 family)|nr:UPF0179 family protein [Candidatus Thermoplasmatota archaeon]
MPLVTLVGEKIAREDNEFIYIGPNNDCRNCKLKTVCFNLKPGRKYKITKIRDKKHSCSIHEGNTAVVEVIEMPLIVAIEKNLLEGNTIKIEKKTLCRNIGCSNIELCNNPALQNGKTYAIKNVYDPVICPIEKDLKKVELADQ